VALVVSGFWRAPGSAGFDRCVSPGLPPFPDIAAAPSSATIAAPQPGTLRCNTVGALDWDESADRIPSIDNGASGVPGGIVSEHKNFLA
jgi:hypothetical protein